MIKTNKVKLEIHYDHIIRDENAYCEIKRYIQENPLKWDLDEYNPHA